MNKQELCQLIQRELLELYNDHEINNIANYILNKIEASSHYKMDHITEISSQDWFTDWLKRLKNGEPIQYISESAPFMHLDLRISNQVLIPRPETEELAHTIYLQNKEINHLRVLDIGSGSGCISLYLKSKMKDWEVFGFDISESAILCAQENANKLGIRVDFQHVNFLDKELWPKSSWDLIVSNPPYISIEETALMDPNVLKYEPAIALFADHSDSLIFYRRIAEFGAIHLKERGLVYLELNEFKAKEIKQIFIQMNYSQCLIMHDYLNKPRFLKCIK